MASPLSRDVIKRSLPLLVMTLIAAPTAILRAQTGPEVNHTGLECIPSTEFAILSATIRPPDEVQTARVYFRSDKYPEYYYVDMDGMGEGFGAALPKPSKETSRVYYYIEAVDLGFGSTRTVEHHPEVVDDEDECKRRDPAAGVFVRESPGIVVGAVRAGMPSIPPGFLAEGIVGFATLSGASGSGAGAATAIAVGAGVASAVGLGVLAADHGGEATTTMPAVVSPSPPLPATTTVGTATGVIACFTTSPNPPEVEVGERIQLDGRCSEPAGSLQYNWELGDGRLREGPFIEPSYAAPGTYGVALTVRRVGENEGDSDRIVKQVVVREPVGADLSVSKTSSPNPFIPFAQNLTYTIRIENRGPATVTGVRVVDNLPAGVLVVDQGGCRPSGAQQLICDMGTVEAGAAKEVSVEVSADPLNPPGSSIINRVEVRGNEPDPDPGNNSATETTLVAMDKVDTSSRQVNVALTSFLAIASGHIGGNLILNGAWAVAVSSGASYTHNLRGRPGENVLEAYPTAAPDEEGYWRFDFNTAEGFLSGSIRVDSGEVISLDGRSVVFRLAGEPRIRFHFEVAH